MYEDREPMGYGYNRMRMPEEYRRDLDPRSMG